MHRSLKILSLILAICCLLNASNPDLVNAETRARAFDSINLLKKKSLKPATLGINAFVNDSRFGSINAQFREVKNTLKLKQVRVLFAWDDNVQPSPNIAPDFSFYDNILRGIPTRVNALVILTGVPSWMEDPDNWIDNDPRKTYVEKWVKPVLARYANNKRVRAWQFWNEPNMASDTDNDLLELRESPQNYIEMLSMAASASRQITPKKLVVSAATTAINQNFPETLEYNQALKEAGIENLVDIYAVHIYGTHLENFLLTGVGDYLNSIQKPIWITESGEQGVNKQANYAQRMWPFLLEQFPKIKRIYIYQFTESTHASSTYGLKNLTPGAFVSDLYIYLRGLRKR